MRLRRFGVASLSQQSDLVAVMLVPKRPRARVIWHHDPLRGSRGRIFVYWARAGAGMAGGGTIYGRGALILRVGACHVLSNPHGATCFERHMAANLDVTGQIWVFLTAIIIVKHPLITFVLIGRRTVRSDAHYKKTTILFDTVKTAIFGGLASLDPKVPTSVQLGYCIPIRILYPN